MKERFQSTRPRGARLSYLLYFEPFEVVSIHAPAWGATAACFRPRRRGCVSIHAPAWGATGCSVGHRAGAYGFNPRARVGRDSVLETIKLTGERFNPRARVGRDSSHPFSLPP